jgi:hypothetical protein
MARESGELQEVQKFSARQVAHPEEHKVQTPAEL